MNSSFFSSLASAVAQSQQQPGRSGNNKLEHQVNVPSFQMAATPVTLGMFKKFITAAWRQDLLTKEFNEANKYGDNVPVTYVSWHDAQDFIAWVNKVDGGGYRLPSEAEWEYAGSSGGADSDWRDGDKIVSEYDGRSYSSWQPRSVKQKRPNAFGLFDINGIVSEWVQDYWHENFNGAPIDGSSWSDDSSSDTANRVKRGTSQDMVCSYVYSSVWLPICANMGATEKAKNYYTANQPHLRTRYKGSPNHRDNHTGFRLARTLPP